MHPARNSPKAKISIEFFMFFLNCRYRILAFLARVSEIFIYLHCRHVAGDKIQTMKFFFISTSHLEENIWFKDDDDFKTGMNYVAVAAFLCGVNVLSFILMSNHVHFLLECTESEAEAFINKYKKLYSYYYWEKYGTRQLLRRNEADIQEVGLVPESLERVIAYILMNCVAARICLHISGYKWGTCNTFFNLNRPKSIPLSQLSVRKKRELLKSRVELPGYWALSEDGYVLPESYVCVDFVETLFSSPARMNYFLNTSSKARSSKLGSGPSFKDQNISAAMVDICQSLFQKNGPGQLIREEKRELLKQLSRRFGTDLNQLCRVSGIPYSEAARMLDEL